MALDGPNLRARNGRPYGALSYVRGRWILSGLEPHVAIRLKANFPSVHKAQTDDFEFPDHANICADLAWFMQRYPLEISDADAARLIEKKQIFERQRDDIESILTPSWTPPARHGFKPGFSPWLIQSQAAEMVHRTKFLLLGDTVGNGKTFSALSAIVGSPHLPAAYVTKPHLADQLVDEFVEPYTYLKSHIIKGRTPYKLPPANLYIFKYSNISAWADIAATGMFKTFIADEVHELRTGLESAKGQAARIFAMNAEINLAMSGTVVWNYGDEAFNIVDLFVPGLLGSREDFQREWCTFKGTHALIKDPDAFGTYLREIMVFLRRVREGRPVNTEIIEVATEFEEIRKVDDICRQLAMTTLSGRFQESGQAALDLDWRLRQATGLAKAKGVAAVAKMFLSQRKPVLLFGWHRSVFDVWLKELAEFNPVMFTGSEDARKKKKNKSAFMNGETDIAIFSLRSGDGVDGLQHRCSTVIFGEYDWSPGVHEQDLGRVDRPGQRADVIDAVYCHANIGSDPTILAIHGIKKSQAYGIMNPLAGVQPVYHDETRIKALAENYLSQCGSAP